METTTTTSNGNKLVQIWNDYTGPDDKLAERIFRAFSIRLTISNKEDLCSDMTKVLKDTVAYNMTDPRDWYQRATYFDRRKAAGQRIVRMIMAAQSKTSATAMNELARCIADLCDFDLLPLVHAVNEDINGPI